MADELMDAIGRLDAEQRAAALLSTARTYLLFDRKPGAAFFAHIALRTKQVPDWSVERAETDGREVRYNPAWLATLAPQEALTMLVHEALHIANHHATRRGNRDTQDWNYAADAAVNSLLKQSAYQLTSDAVLPGGERLPGAGYGLSAEQYYDLLPPRPPAPQEPQSGGPQGSPHGGTHGGTGDGADDATAGGAVGLCDVVDPRDASAVEADAQSLVAEAAEVAKSRGTLPGHIQKLIGEALASRTDWRHELAEFVRASTSHDDYTWSRPNRRHVWRNLYLPSTIGEQLGRLAIAIDCSGSISDRELELFAGELQAVAELLPIRLTLIYHDAIVQHVETWEPIDGPLTLTAHGRGGTDHRPVFAWLDQQDEPFDALVSLTDLETCFPDREPDFPTLWAVTRGVRHVPFGRVVPLEVR